RHAHGHHAGVVHAGRTRGVPAVILGPRSGDKAAGLHITRPYDFTACIPDHADATWQLGRRGQRHAAGVDPVDRLVRVAALGPPDIAGTRGLLVPLPGGLDPSVHRLGERLPLPIDQLPAPVVMPDGCRTAGEPF